MPQKIMLTIAEPLYEKLQLRMKKEGYLSVQELINAIIRQALIKQKKNTGTRKSKSRASAKGNIISEDKKFMDYFSEDE